MVINAKPCLLSARPLHSPTTRDTLFPIRICKRMDRKANGEEKKKKRGGTSGRKREEREKGSRSASVRRTETRRRVSGSPGYIFLSELHARDAKSTHTSYKASYAITSLSRRGSLREKKKKMHATRLRAGEKLAERISKCARTRTRMRVMRLVRASCQFGGSIARTWCVLGLLIDRDADC